MTNMLEFPELLLYPKKLTFNWVVELEHLTRMKPFELVFVWYRWN